MLLALFPTIHGVWETHMNRLNVRAVVLLLVAQSPALRPGVKLGAKGVCRAKLVVEMAMNR